MGVGVVLMALLALGWLNAGRIKAFVSPGTTTSQSTAAEALDIVFVADFSGPNKLVGEDLARGFEDALKAHGAHAALRIVRRDDQGRPEATLALAEGAASSF